MKRGGWALVGGGVALLLLGASKASAAERRGLEPDLTDHATTTPEIVTATELRQHRPSQATALQRGGDLVVRNIARALAWSTQVAEARRTFPAVPAWLLFGHLSFEADGNAALRTATTTEVGLFQINAGTAKSLGVDHAKLVGKSWNDQVAGRLNTLAGAQMYAGFGAKLAKAATFATDDDRWRVAYAVNFLPSQARKIVSSTSSPATWEGFVAAARDLVERGSVSRAWLKGVDNNDVVWRFGHYLAGRAGIA